MDLETRVTAVEENLAAFRSETKQEIHDLRLETRGWAQFAVRADRKADIAAELLRLIHADVKEIKEEHGKKLDEHGKKLDEHGTMLGEHGTMLGELRTTVSELSTTVNGHTQMLGELSTTVNGHTVTLDEHGKMLRQILAKLS
jgi:Mg2+ and Co2+ transporter CorA